MPPYRTVSRARMPSLESAGAAGGFMGCGTRRRDGLDERRLAQLPAERHDRDPDDVGERVDVLVPGLFQQLLGGHDGATAPEQFGENREFLVPQRQRPAISRGLLAGRVEPDAGPLQDRRIGWAGPRPRARTRATSSANANGLAR